MTGEEKYAALVAEGGYAQFFVLSGGKQPMFITPYGLHLIEEVPEGDIEAMGREILAEAAARWAEGDILSRFPIPKKKPKKELSAKIGVSS